MIYFSATVITTVGFGDITIDYYHAIAAGVPMIAGEFGSTYAIVVIYVPSLPLWVGIAIAFAARNSAVYFTRWYPQYRRAKYGSPAAPAAAMKS